MNSAQLQNELVNVMHSVFGEFPEKAHQPRYTHPDYILEILGDGWVTEEVTQEEIVKIWLANLPQFQGRLAPQRTLVPRGGSIPPVRSASPRG